MRGSVRKRGDPGTWEYRLELGLQPAQRCQVCGVRRWLERRRLEVCPDCQGELVDVQERRQRTRAGFRTKRAAQEALDKAKVAEQRGETVEPSKLTVREYLLNTWLPAAKGSRKPSTYQGYRTLIEAYVVPELGALPLQKLSPEAISDAYTRLQHEGRVKKTGGLSALSVRHVHACLHRALSDAVRQHKIARNPTDFVDDLPRVEERELSVWTGDELRAFLDSTRGDRLHGLWYVLATTGLRRGEALALRWPDLDFEHRRLAVRRNRVSVNGTVCQGSTKTKGGRRTVTLDGDTVAVLQEQAARQLDEQDTWGEAWQASGYVFTREDGEPLHPDLVSRLFEKAVSAAKLPRIRLHDLRHTMATLALEAGVHPKVVSERLGHANIGITLNRYTHVLGNMQAQAAEAIGALVAGRKPEEPSDPS